MEKLVAVICEKLAHVDKLDDQFADMVTAADRDLSSHTQADWRQLLREEAELAKERENIQAAVRQLGPHELLQSQLDAWTEKRDRLLLRRHQLEHHRPDKLVLPASLTALREMLREEFAKLAIESPEFGTLLRQVVPQFHVYAVRLCDGGHLYPRARVVLDLIGNFADAKLVPGLSELLTTVVTLDLFAPPQRERIRAEAVRLSAEGKTQREIAQAIAERPTTTAVQKALSLNGKMVSAGLADPYVIVHDPPDDYPKLRRHKHSRYRFQPRDGYERPEL